MCGRFAQIHELEKLNAQLQLDLLTAEFELTASYNVAPTQAALAVRYSREKKGRTLDYMNWGLVPPWAKDTKLAPKLINARSENIAIKPAFRQAIKFRRCLIPISGFYEWKVEDNVKQPFYFKDNDDRVLALAGIWEKWQSPEGNKMETFSILTVNATESIKQIHERMPLIVQPEDYETWLNPEIQNVQHIKSIFQSRPKQDMIFYQVSAKINQVSYNAPDCIIPLQP